MADPKPLKQNDIDGLPVLESFRYENIFNLYQNDISQYYYNILAKVNFPSDIEESFYETYVVAGNSTPWTLISYQIYGTTLLWWLVCAVNNIQNPVFFPKAGTQLKYLKPSIARSVIAQISGV